MVKFLKEKNIILKFENVNVYGQDFNIEFSKQTKML